MKKILMLLSNAFVSDPRVLNEAIALIEDGHSVTLFAWDRGEGGAREEIKEGVKIRRFFFPSQHAAGIRQIFPLSIIWVKWFIAGLALAFDVVHCHDFDTLPVGWCLAKIKKKKVVFDSHEVYSGMMTGHLPSGAVSFIERLETLFVKRADALIVSTELYLKQYAALPALIALVGNWKRTEDYELSETEKGTIRASYGIRPDALLVTYIASLGRDRIIEPLLKVVAGLGPKVALVIAGTGVQQPIVESYQQANIKYLGFLSSQREIARLTAVSDAIYYGIDVGTFGGRNNNPNKLYEALAAGKPFISVEAGESGELIKKYGIGILMRTQSEEELGSILMDLCDDPEKRKEMGKSALRLAREQYNWGLAKRNLLDLYAKL